MERARARERERERERERQSRRVYIRSVGVYENSLSGMKITALSRVSINLNAR